MLDFPRSSRAVLVAVLLAAGAVAVVPAAPAAAYPGSTVEIDGHGYGHGRGMGQYGALGYAVDAGWGYRDILAHFYSNTGPGDVGNPTITVRLTTFDGVDTIVQQERGRMTTNAAGGSFNALRAVRTGPNSFRVDSAPHCGGPWTQIRSGMAGPVVFAPQNRNDDRQDMLQACEPSGAMRWVRGEVRAVEGPGTIRTVNALDLNGYVKGVVPREMPASWADLGGGRGINALKAQAVAARSYGWSESRYAYAKTCDTQACQVYGGRALQVGAHFRDLEDGRSDRAVDETPGEVRMLGGAVARTEYSSSTGGHTAGGVFPAVVDDGDRVSLNPYHGWHASIPVSEVEATYPQVGSLVAIGVLQRNGIGDYGGRAREVRVHGTRSAVTLSAEDFRLDLGLRSDWFNVVVPGGYWVSAADGGVHAYAQAPFHGSMAGAPLAGPVVGIAGTPSGNGYWLAAGDGGVFTFGDAPFRGSMGGRPLERSIVGIARTASGQGYWLAADDGGIHPFGDAAGHGSMRGRPLDRPVVGIAATPSGRGYWLVASDGGVFTFGDAAFRGSTGGQRLDQPVVGMAPTPSGQGYWLVASDGGVFTFGDAVFSGSLGGRRHDHPFVGMAPTATGLGYWLLRADGSVTAFGDATYHAASPSPVPAKVAIAPAPPPPR